MFDKRLLKAVKGSTKYIVLNVFGQWIGLLASLFFMRTLARLLADLCAHTFDPGTLLQILATFGICACVRYLSVRFSVQMSDLSSRGVRMQLREMIYRKLQRLGPNYDEQIPTSEIVQVTTEGVDQLETYFGSYLPQFFYAVLAPVTLFIALLPISFISALVLLLCVPMIPVSIIVIQKWAKKLLSRYWGQYTEMGDTFLENLQGLTTLKIYQADEYKNKQMNEAAEAFRRITMRVLIMQLNSVSVMDVTAYGGAGLGAVVAVLQLAKGNIDLFGCLFIILMAADFFLPMRTLGSYFHISMNGAAAADRIFNFLALPEDTQKTETQTSGSRILFEHVNFAYTEDREILKDICLEIPEGSFTAVVGKSGSGKSTIASLLTGRRKIKEGSLTIGGTDAGKLSDETRFRLLTEVGAEPYIFKGTVREMLLAGRKNASDEEMQRVLEQVGLWAFLQEQDGLDTVLQERGTNFSGGQRQRLAIACAILRDTPVYIFDEAASNIDKESEERILKVIRELADTHTVIMITHRMSSALYAERAVVLQDGRITETGDPKELLKKNGPFRTLYDTQRELEEFGGAQA